MHDDTAPKTAAPARFQDRAALFGVEPNTESIVFATTEACGLSDGLSGSALLGCSIQEVLGRLAAHAIRNAQAQPSIRQRRFNLGQFDCGTGHFDVSMFQSENALIVEAIPADPVTAPTAREVLADVIVLSDALVGPEAERGSSPFTRFVSLLRTMSGYNCVAIEQFLEEGPSIIDMAGQERFASGRLISSSELWNMQDVRRSSVGLALQEGIYVPDLGLSSFSVPELLDRTELQELGVVACAAIDVKRGKDPWGRIKFFHSHPRLPNARTQLALAHLSPLISQRLLSL